MQQILCYIDQGIDHCYPKYSLSTMNYPVLQKIRKTNIIKTKEKKR